MEFNCFGLVRSWKNHLYSSWWLTIEKDTMMSNLVSERSYIRILSGKRLHEYDDSGTCFLRGFKRPRVFAIQHSPSGCCAAAFGVRNEGGRISRLPMQGRRPNKSSRLLKCHELN